MTKLIWMIGLSLMLTMQIAWSQLNDPTRPANYLGTDGSGGRHYMTVSAILTSAKRKIAIINNQSLQVGDTIGNAKLIAIGANSVQFRDSAGDFTVILHEPIRKNEVSKIVKKDHK